ncbi:MAG: hypothetical protein WCL37_01780, partial [Chrysiogenales bacterium]
QGLKVDGKYTSICMDHYIDFAVKDRKSFLAMRKRYEGNTDERYPQDWDVFVERCLQFRLPTIVYYALLAAKEQQNGLIPELVFARLRPGWLRRRWLDRYLRPGTFPIYRFPEQRLTQIKIRLLLPLIDRLSDWPRYLLRLGRVYGKSFWQRYR